VVRDGDFSGTQQKMDSFKAGYGTVLFFEDEAVVKSRKLRKYSGGTKLFSIKPCLSNLAIHSASEMSVFLPGTFLIL
jgi:hypothetical protein